MAQTPFTLKRAFRFSFFIWLWTFILGGLALTISLVEPEYSEFAFAGQYVAIFSFIFSFPTWIIFWFASYLIGSRDLRNKNKVLLMVITMALLYIPSFMYLLSQQVESFIWYHVGIGILLTLFRSFVYFPPESKIADSVTEEQNQNN